MGWHVSAVFLDAADAGATRAVLRALGVDDPGPPARSTLRDALHPVGLAIGASRGRTILTGSAAFALMFDDAAMRQLLETVGVRRAVALFVEDATNAYYYACYEDGRRVCARGGAADDDEIVEGVSWNHLLPEELDYFGGEPPERDHRGRPVLVNARGERFEHFQLGGDLAFAVAARVLGAPFDTMDGAFFATPMQVFEDVDLEDRRSRRAARRAAAGRTKSLILWSILVVAALVLVLRFV